MKSWSVQKQQWEKLEATVSNSQQRSIVLSMLNLCHYLLLLNDYFKIDEIAASMSKYLSFEYFILANTLQISLLNVL